MHTVERQFASGVYVGNRYAIAGIKTFGESAPQVRKAGIAVRLKNNPNAGVRKTLAGGGQGSPNLSGVVGVVVVKTHALLFPAQLKTPSHAGVTRKRGGGDSSREIPTRPLRPVRPRR